MNYAENLTYIPVIYKDKIYNIAPILIDLDIDVAHMFIYKYKYKNITQLIDSISILHNFICGQNDDPMTRLYNTNSISSLIVETNKIKPKSCKYDSVLKELLQFDTCIYHHDDTLNKNHVSTQTDNYNSYIEYISKLCYLFIGFIGIGLFILNLIMYTINFF